MGEPVICPECGKEMEFDPALWETNGVIEYDCTNCSKSVRFNSEAEVG